MLYRYKPDEGRNARQTAFWLGVGMIFFGCYALNRTLLAVEALRGPVTDAMPDVPLLGVRLTGAFLVASLVFLVGAILYVRFLARERVADHLIEVETEMRKVTWPSFAEASNSSLVVIVTVLILMAFLALADFVLGRVFQIVLFGGAGGA